MRSARHNRAVLSFAQALLRAEGIRCMLLLDIAEEKMKNLEGWAQIWIDEEEPVEDEEAATAPEHGEEEEEAEEEPETPLDEKEQSKRDAQQSELESEAQGIAGDAVKGASLRQHMARILGMQTLDTVKYNTPDLIHIKGWTSRERIPRDRRKECTITIYEFTYTAENEESISTASRRKREKYEELKRHLLGLGYAKVELRVVTGGVRGWTPRATDDDLKKWGFTPKNRSRLQKEWAMSAWRWLAAIIRTRRYWELHPKHVHKSGLQHWRQRVKMKKQEKKEAGGPATPPRRN